MGWGRGKILNIQTINDCGPNSRHTLCHNRIYGAVSAKQGLDSKCFSVGRVLEPV